MAETAPFTVLTYNIRAGLGSAGPDRKPQEARGAKLDLAPIIAAIKSTNADVVALQEVIGDAQAREIGSALGMAHVYARHGAVHGKWWGLATLSRFPIIRHQSIAISSGRGNTRSDLVAVIRIAGSDVTFVNVHVDKDLKDGAPIKGTLKHIAKVSGPLIVLGDFNARPQTRRLAPIRARLVDVADIATARGADTVREHATWTRDGRIVDGARLDYIFIDQRFLEAQAVSVLKRDHWRASDHIGVTAVLAIKARP